MIGYLEGRILDLAPGKVVLSAGGVGYEISVPLSSHPLLAGSESAALFVHTHVREDVLALYGFPSRRERDTFRLLLGVSGIGPRTALALLSSLTPDDLVLAIESEQWRRLAAVPGIGKRTAERLVVELKGKLGDAVQPIGGAPVRDDAVSALINLGYPARAAEEVVADLLRATPDLELGLLLRQALKKLVR
jgi:Holliday junction DNA helicase RuvA